ncbi:MAG: hypothetical protein E7173_00255 [Firmicutes bacterium]|nr:hypothetical protein [Bacillota bacterium]
MTRAQVKKQLYDYLGESVTIRYNLGRNKYEQYRVKIKELYNNIFLVQTDIDNQVKSFSYTDVITKTIRIKF